MSEPELDCSEDDEKIILKCARIGTKIRSHSQLSHAGICFVTFVANADTVNYVLEIFQATCLFFFDGS